YGLAYSQFRSTVGKPRGKFVQVEPRMTQTGANADEWLAASPGSEGGLALAIAQVIVRENLVKDASPPKFLSDPLDAYAPEKTEALTGVEPERVKRIAREFAESSHSLAISGGETSGMLVNTVNTAGEERRLQADHIAINFLNLIVGNLNKPGGVLLPRDDAFDLLEDVQPDGLLAFSDSFGSETITSKTRALLVHAVNPIHAHPATADKIENLPFIASFSAFIDETTALADLILPDSTYLEKWNVTTTHADFAKAAVSIAQPVIKAESN